MIYYDIIPYKDKNLDCYQNMLVTLLHHYGCDINLLGAVLPWRYHYRKNKNEITNCYIANDKNIEQIYGYKVIRRKFKSKKVIETLAYIVKRQPIIVNVDQYYVPHHYFHIYQKQHGQHSLILNGYDENKKKFYCVDTLPQYSGEISSEEIEKGIINFPYDYIKLEYSYIERKTYFIKSDGDIFQTFFDSSDAYQCLEESAIFSNKKIISLIDEINLESNETYFCELSTIFQGNWIWELDRVADWTVSYLDMDFVRKIYGDNTINLLSSLIKQCNIKIVEAYRIIYKSLLNKSKVTLNKGYEKLKEVIFLQDEIYKVVKNEKEFGKI